MRSVWRLPQDELPPSDLAGRTLHSVLVEFDGPEIAIVSGPDDQMRLSVACDEEDDALRWLEATLSVDQWLALFEGRLCVRDALRQSHVYIVDQRHDGTPLRGWQVSFESLHEQVLPAPGALLPLETRHSYLHEPDAPPRLSEHDALVRQYLPGMERAA